MTKINETAGISIDNLSTEELEKMLAQRKERARQEELRKRQEYEETRDMLVSILSEDALKLQKELCKFKSHTFEMLQEFYKQMQEYAGTTRDSKGNFQLKSRDGKFKIIYRKQTVKGYDERAAQAEVLLKDFMQSFVKKRDLQTYNLLMALLERNTITGDYDPNLIGKLVKRRNDFTDERWLKAIDLFVESWSMVRTVDYVQFFCKSELNAWVPIVLNFASVAIDDKKK